MKPFREVQKPGLLLVIPVCIACGGAAWWGFVQQILLGIKWGDRPAPDVMLWIFFVLFGIIFPLFMFSVKLVVETRKDALRISFVPVCTRLVAYDTIRQCRVRTYRPLLEYGGWGVKWGGKKGWSYTMSGNCGVQLELHDGKKLLIGSRNPEELAAAIEQRRKEDGCGNPSSS